MIDRAKELVEELVSADITDKVREIGSGNEKNNASQPNKKGKKEENDGQMSLFDTCGISAGNAQAQETTEDAPRIPETWAQVIDQLKKADLSRMRP